MVEQEYEAVTETFYRIVDSCFKKCIPPKYIEGELNKGESVCIDRCFSKYIDVTTKIGEALTKKRTGSRRKNWWFWCISYWNWIHLKSNFFY